MSEQKTGCHSPGQAGEEPAGKERQEQRPGSGMQGMMAQMMAHCGCGPAMMEKMAGHMGGGPPAQAEDTTPQKKD